VLWQLSPMRFETTDWLAIAVFVTALVSSLLIVIAAAHAVYLGGKGLFWP
jgi:hypothetical protein